MKTSIGISADTSAQFAQITSALNVVSGSVDFDAARTLWSQLAEGIEAPRVERDPRVRVRLEEALVWRILSLRMLHELGPQAIFQERTKGAGTGTASTHPAIEAIAKTYERLKRTMDELTPEPQSTREPSATGLPMRMLKLLQESEGALEQVLGIGPGESSPFTPKLAKREDCGDSNGA